MTLPLKSPRGRPQLRLVSSQLQAVQPPPLTEDWRRIAAAVVSCTYDLSQALHEQRWGLVDETLRERRELLELLARLDLDADGRRCLRSLEQALQESEDAIR